MQNLNAFCVALAIAAKQLCNNQKEETKRLRESETVVNAAAKASGTSNALRLLASMCLCVYEQMYACVLICKSVYVYVCETHTPCTRSVVPIAHSLLAALRLILLFATPNLLS